MMSLNSCSGGLESAIQHALPSSDLGKLHDLSPKSQDAVAIANLCQWKEWDPAGDYVVSSSLLLLRGVERA